MSPLRALLLACACLSLVPSARALNRQFNTFTAASSQPLAVNPAVETLENCPTCVPPTKAESLLARECPTCPIKRALPPVLRGDCVECLTGEDTATSTAPFTTVVDTCSDCEPFELHPHVGWSVDTDLTGTGVNLGNGNLFTRKTDIDIPGRGFSFRFVRRHVSGLSYDGPLGWNWDFSYNMRIVTDGAGDAWLHDGTGRADEFVLSGGSYTTPTGRFESLTNSGAPAKYYLTKPNSTVYQFGGSSGRLESITDRAGNAMSFSYDSESRLSTVSDTLSRTITFAYDTNGRISTITDFDSRVWTFAYDTSGNLSTVTTPGVTGFTSGKTTTYTYTTNHELDTVTDPKSQLIIDATYTSGKVTALRYGDSGDNYAFSYNTGTGVTTVTDRNGNDRAVTVSSAGQPTQVVDKTNRTVRSGEGDYTTTYTFNSDGLLATIDFPRGNDAIYTYQTGSARARTNLTIEELKNSSGTASLKTAWSYESTHNLVKQHADARASGLFGAGYTTTYYYDYEEASLGDLNGDGVTTGTDGVLVKIAHPTVTSQVPSLTPVDKLRQNANGQVTRWDNPDGDVTTYEYYTTGDPTGYLKKQIVDDESGGLQLATEWTYDKVGNIASIKDPRGHTVSYTVNDLNQVTLFTTPISSTVDFDTKYEYDGNDNVTKKEVENLDGDGSAYSNTWITTTWTHETLNRIATRVDEVSSSASVTTSFLYDDNRNLTKITTPLGGHHVTTFAWDERDLLYRKTRGETSGTASTEEYTYDGNRNVTAHSSGEANVTTCMLDAWERVTNVVDPEGYETDTSYDNIGNVTTLDRTGPSGTKDSYEKTETSWNEAGRPYQIRQKYRKLTTDSFTNYDSIRTYTTGGRVATLADPRGKATVYTYDGACRLIVTEDEYGNKVTLTLDGNGNVTHRDEFDKAQAGSGYDVTRGTDYTYDKRNLRLTEVRDPGSGMLNLTTTWKYDSRGNRVHQTDARSNNQDWAYDGRNLMTSATEDRISSTRTTTTYAYDDNSNLTSITDDNSHATSFSYDELERRTTRTDADAETFTWTYDKDDHVTGWTDENGTVVADTLDDRGLVTNRAVTRATGVEGTTFEEYTYDPVGRMLTAENDDSVVTLKWDTVGRVYEESITWSVTPSVTRTVSRDFDAAGNVTKLTYPDATAIDYVIDSDLNRIDQVKDGSNIVADYRYLGPMIDKLDYLNGVTRTATYDAVRRMSVLEHAKTSTLAKFTYTYDANSNVLSEQRTHNASLYEVFTYDKRNELDTVYYDATTSSSPSVYSKKREHAWDGVFNLDSMTTTVGGSGTTVNYTNNSRNAYTAIGGSSPTYTANGELSDDKVLYTYKYDYRGELRKLTTGSTNFTCKYDALGRRIMTNFGTEVRYTWGVDRIVEEITSASTPTVTAKWVHGNDREAIRMARSGVMSYYHADASGSVEKLTDTTGSVVESCEYDAFGKPSLATSAKGNPFLWGGKFYDYAFGAYAGGRTYDASVTFRYFTALNGSWYRTEGALRYLRVAPCGIVQGVQRRHFIAADGATANQANGSGGLPACPATGTRTDCKLDHANGTGTCADNTTLTAGDGGVWHSHGDDGDGSDYTECDQTTHHSLWIFHWTTHSSGLAPVT